MFNGEIIEQVTQYMYLGMLFDCSGNMKAAPNNMKLRALKAIFKLRNSLKSCNIKPVLSMKLFDQLIKPICLYGSEIWGNLHRKISKDDKQIFKLFDELPVEKIHIRYCKYTLGVHSKAVNAAVQGGLGRYPIYIDLILGMYKFLIHIRDNEPDNEIIEAAYRECTSLHKAGKKSCLACMHNLNKMMGMPNANDIGKVHLATLRVKLKQKFINEWRERVYGRGKNQGEGKLSTYRVLKSAFQYEGYLHDIICNRDRSALCRLRISAHRLQIEQGRYNKTPREERYCPHCSKSGNFCIESEMHCVVECPRFEGIRETTFKLIAYENKNFDMLSPHNKFIYLMTAEGETVRAFGSLCSVIIY